MKSITQHPVPSVETLECLGLADLLDGYIARERVSIRFLQLERFAHEHGYQFDREHGNIYGKPMLVPTPPAAPQVIIRLITRSDHAAVHGSRTRRAA